jgi:uncharacterized protein YkwD
MRYALLFAWTATTLSCVSAGVASSAAKEGGTVGNGSASIALDVVSATNSARARRGLAALAVSSKLMEAARIQAEQMAAFQRADHVITGAQYPTPESRLAAVGYSYSSVGENVAWNQRDPQSAVDAWMNSAPHRANILDPGYTEMGAAMARSSKGEPYWVQVFGRPR